MIAAGLRPNRIISLVPSLTELLHDLGASDKVVGITKFCVRPEEWYRNKPRVGGTKNINFEKIASLTPDLIIANKEENQQEQIEKLMKHHPVWVTDIKTLDDSLFMIKEMGILLGENENAGTLSDTIQNEFKKLERFTMQFYLNTPKILTAYLIWYNPLMCAGVSTFIDDMLGKCGLQNCFSDHQKSRYPETSVEELKKLNPELILLSSEPYPFKEKHLEEFREFFPGTSIQLVDGELFSWYGSRLKQSPGYFIQCLNQLK
jgi:ABC-type Fe3+-hydroxamate transport system substrate-binding protein